MAIATELFGPAASLGTSWYVVAPVMTLVPPLTAVALVNTADQLCPELLLMYTPVACGLLGEVMIRTYFETQGRRIYAVREILTQKKRGVVDEAR